MIQNQVINYLLKTGDSSLLLLNNINADFFSDYKEEYKFIAEHLNKYNKIPDIETFLAKFTSFDVVAVTENPDYLVDALYEDKNRRFLAKTFNQVRDYLNNGKVEEAMQAYINSRESLSEAKHISCVDLVRDTSRYDKYISKTQDFSKFYVKTGFDELDRAIGGWDKFEELGTIVARPNVGKSFIILKSAIAAAQQGLSVGLYSGEMSEDKVGYRFDTLLSHISNTSIMRGNASIQLEYKRFLENLPNIVSGSLKILTPSMCGGSVGVTALRAFIEKEKLDILFIDQHSLLDDDRKARNPVERAANISKDLKMLQVLKKIPIIAVSQQNRTGTEDSSVNLTQIAASDRIGQDSTTVLFLEQVSGQLKMTLVKSRDSMNGKVLNFAMDIDKGIFTYIPTESDALEGQDCESLRDMYESDCPGDEPF